MPPLTPYEGNKKKLVLAFDVGTTYSGISYCILEPGQVPEIKGVTKFPAQDLLHGSSKIPSVIYYDENGAVRAIGAEALCAGIYERAQDEGWIKVEWFKLQFRSSNIAISDTSVNTFMSALPAEKNAVEILADYLEYLFRCSREFIESSLPAGKELWESLKDSIDFVLSHPNGWEGLQQSQIRRAGIIAKLIGDEPSQYPRISFVTEGEASLHFAILHCLPLGSVRKSGGVVIVDAGGGTIDMSAYKQFNRLVDVKYEEIAIRTCHLEGSMFVTRRLETLLQGRLRGSKFADDVPHIASCFDMDTKLRFTAGGEPQYIKFGSVRDNDEKYGIRFGQLKLSSSDIASCFEPSINRIVNDIEEIIKATPEVGIKRVVLVGGFAANDWLYQCVNEAMLLYGVLVTRPNFHVTKAVADGAIFFHLEHRVRQRISTTTLGIELWTEHDRTNSEHRSRYKKATRRVDSKDVKRTLVAFFIMLRKGENIVRGYEIRKYCYKVYSNADEVEDIEFTILSYHGDRLPKERQIWLDNKSLFSTMCIIKANLRHLRGTSTVKKLEGSFGSYFRLDFDIILVFSDAEVKAMVAWDEAGKEKWGCATIVYEGTLQSI